MACVCRKKGLVDSQQIKHIKMIQENEARKWQGLQIQYTSRPGIANLHTSRKYQKISEYAKVSDTQVHPCFMCCVFLARGRETEGIS